MSNRPTHRLKVDGSLVFPEGYAAADIEVLPAGYYDAIDLAAAEASLIARVDRKREQMRSAVMTQGVGQSYAYAQKAAEVRDYRNTLASVIAALTNLQRTTRFPFAMAEVTATGDALATVIARIEAGMIASCARIAAVEAAAVLAKRRIRAATSAAAKKAAYDTATWPA
ncbi:hypothetical protein [Sphingobium abikonense]|uniref:hypothetical protein n=1 Tax=Sphingobium abikonense TaxID=86193 RepID=UPI0035188278